MERRTFWDGQIVRGAPLVPGGQTLFCLEIDTDRPEREGVRGVFRHSDYGESTAFSEPFSCFGRSEICESEQPLGEHRPRWRSTFTTTRAVLHASLSQAGGPQRV